MIYIGTDSVVHKNHVVYVTAVVEIKPDYQKITSTRVVEPHVASLSQRMWREYSLTVDAWTSLGSPQDCELHFDVNPNKRYKSSKVYKQIKAAANLTQHAPKFKPDSWCATHLADRLARK